MKPPPPMLPAVGCTTASANAVATAASIAVPPSLMPSAPTFDAIAFLDRTMPPRARTGTEPEETVGTATAHAATIKRRFISRHIRDRPLAAGEWKHQR